jgi:hypothetical protein
MEALTKLFHLSGPTYCICSTFSRADFFTDLRDRVFRALERDLIVSPADSPPPRPEHAAACRSLLELCYVNSAEAAAGAGGSSSGESKRGATADAFVAFFPGPWTGVPLRKKERK